MQLWKHFAHNDENKEAVLLTVEETYQQLEHTKAN